MNAIIGALCVFAAFGFGVFVSFASGWAYRVQDGPTPEQMVDSYLWSTDRVLLNAECMRDLARQLDLTIIDESDRKAWVFRRLERIA